MSTRVETDGQITRSITEWWVSDRRLWLTADRSKVVDEAVDYDNERAFLFAMPGQAVPLEDARRYGLVKQLSAKG